MITRCADLPENMQVAMMDRVRKWKATSDAAMLQTFTTPSNVMYGRGNTPRTYVDYLNMKRHESRTTLHDYLITTDSNELVGVMGYSRLYVSDDVQVIIGSFYFIEFEPLKYEDEVQDALEYIYEEMLTTGDETNIQLPTFKSKWNENRYIPKEHHRVIQVYDYKHTNARFEEVDGKRYILKGYKKIKGG